MTVVDKNIELAKGAANDAAVDNAGITIDSTQWDKTWQWKNATDAWTSSEHIHVAAGNRFGFADDPNTYIDRPNADVIAFTNGGTERLRIRSDGKVSIGHTTGDGLINTLNTGVNQQILQFKVNLPSFSNRTLNLYGPETDTTSGFFTFQTGDAVRFQIESIDALTVASDGQIGIGTTNPSNKLHIKSSDDTLALFESTDGLAQIQFKDNSSNANLPTIGIQGNSFYFDNMGSTSLRIAPGKVGVNEAAPEADFHVNQNEAHSSTYYLDSDAGV